MRHQERVRQAKVREAEMAYKAVDKHRAAEAKRFGNGAQPRLRTCRRSQEADHAKQSALHRTSPEVVQTKPNYFDEERFFTGFYLTLL